MQVCEETEATVKSILKQYNNINVCEGCHDVVQY